MGSEMCIRDRHPQSNQGVCADAIATLEGIDREALDQLAVTSQERAARAIEEGRFDQSIIPVLNEDGSVALDKEEFPRPGTTLEGLSGLRTVFSNWRDLEVDETGRTYGSMIQSVYPELTEFNHVHHAGNSSGVVDGSAAILMTSKAYAEDLSLIHI